MQPIYNQAANGKLATQLFAKDKKEGHAGVWFDKFYTYQIFDQQGRLEPNEGIRKKQKIAEKEQFLAQFKGMFGTCGNSTDLNNHTIRQRLLCQAQGGKSNIYTNDWLMAIGLGNSHPLDNGMLWHPTLGVPYFQGSTVKGMAKALMEKWGADPKLINRWFGSVNLLTTSQKNKLPQTYADIFGQELDEATKEKLNEQNTGAFIFLDAIPVKAVTLKKSIMTPHYGKWYEQGDSKPTATDTQPADWHSPVPIDFLTVENASMQFGVMPRLGAEVHQDEIEQISNVIALALEHLGIGAKTATGYGRMQIDNNENTSYQEKVQKIIDELKMSSLTDEEQVIHNFEKRLDTLQTAWRGKKNIDCGFNGFYKTVMEWDDKQALQQAYDVLITRGKEWQGQALKKHNKWKAKLKDLENKLA